MKGVCVVTWCRWMDVSRVVVEVDGCGVIWWRWINVGSRSDGGWMWGHMVEVDGC